MKTLLLDPRFFNITILALSLLATSRWVYERRWADALYWASASAITFTVTFLYKH